MTDHFKLAEELLFREYRNAKGAYIDAPEKRALDVDAAKAHSYLALVGSIDTLIGVLRDLLPAPTVIHYRGTEPVEADRD